MIIIPYVLFSILPHLQQISGRLTNCADDDMHCYTWIVENSTKCNVVNELSNIYCKKSCDLCHLTPISKEYDLKKTPTSLKSVAFLIGRWRSEFGGKAAFPTIPKFTYGEELDFKMVIEGERIRDILNYTAIAWDNSNFMELHSEYGFLSVINDSYNEIISLNTVMSNGFITIEEGRKRGLSVELHLRRIGRISFSHDSAVHRMLRRWTLLDPMHLEAQLSMSTASHHGLTEHTNIIYEKIYP